MSLYSAECPMSDTTSLYAEEDRTRRVCALRNAGYDEFILLEVWGMMFYTLWSVENSEIMR